MVSQYLAWHSAHTCRCRVFQCGGGIVLMFGVLAWLTYCGVPGVDVFWPWRSGG